MRLRLLISAMAVAGLAIGGPASAKPHAPKPKLSLSQARAIALRLAPGKVISSEYENEGGGWRYSFDIQQKGNVQEIGIDGQTGKIVENKSEGKVDHD
ncbi:MAG: PepSY domain-containing protein [Croceibacterium sp.]